jgi:meiotic recombination protein REC8
MLEDDPEFDLNPVLPAFHFDDDGNLVIPQLSQASRKTSSQLSPLGQDGSFSSSNRSIIGGFDLSQSPFGRGNSIIAEQFGAGTMTPGKEDDVLMPFGDEERELQALDDWGIEIDADGNIMEEPQLPRLPRSEEDEGAHILQEDQPIPLDGEGDVIMSGGNNVFHSDPPLFLRREEEEEEEGEGRGQEGEEQQALEEQEVALEDEASSGQAPVRVQRKRRRPILAPDDQTKITRQELKSWSTNYLANAEQASQPRHGVTPTEARKNAFNLVFGRGIASVGVPTGVLGLPHPLAPHFAGEGLQACLLGIIITQADGEPASPPRGRRRSALEALELEQDEAERRVRPRLGDDEASQDAQPQLPHPDDDALLPIADDDDLPPVEVGRRAEGSLLPDNDIPSDVPWNRPSSQIPSSSIKGGPGSKPPSRQVSASPLHGRGSVLLDIERFSDNDNHPHFGSDDGIGGVAPGSDGGFAPLHSGPGGGGRSLPSDMPLPGGENLGTQTTSQQMRTALDREGRNFLDFVESVARKEGHPISDDDHNNNNKHWVEFTSLLQAEDQKRAVVAQAFYHVLSLATKNVIKVQQDGQGGIEPFGVIRLGVELSSLAVGEDEGDGGDVEMSEAGDE